jgi:phosphatidylglycerol lysyltransferase
MPSIAGIGQTAREWSKSPWVRRVFGAILLFLFGTFLYGNWPEILGMGEVLRSVSLGELLLGLAILAAYIGSQVLSMHLSFRAVDKRAPYLGFLRLYLKRYFLSSFFPLGYTASQYLFAKDLERHGIRRHETHFATTLFVLLGDAAFLLVLIPSVLYLFFTSQLPVAGLVVALFAVALAVAGFWAFANMLRRGPVFRFLLGFVPDLPEALDDWESRPNRWTGLSGAAAAALVAQAAGIGLVALTLASIDVLHSFLLPIFGYVVTILLLTAAPMFQGIGLIEWSLTYGFRELGLAPVEAVSATLLFRLFHLWLPIAVGGAIVLKDRLAGKDAGEGNISAPEPPNG